VKLFRTNCEACGRVYEGNFPMWVSIGPFPCICGERVPAPLIIDESGAAFDPDI
jgi:hypothetical protein